MWVMTPFGYFSIVEPPNGDGSKLVVRTRVRTDLQQFLARAFGTAKKPRIIADKKNRRDYQFRARVPRIRVAEVLASAAMDIDYDNFKEAVQERQGEWRASLYGNIWWELRGLPKAEQERDDANRTNTRPLGVASLPS